MLHVKAKAESLRPYRRGPQRGAGLGWHCDALDEIMSARSSRTVQTLSYPHDGHFSTPGLTNLARSAKQGFVRGSRPILCLFIALLTMLRPFPSASETVPLERQHGTYMISIQINGALVLPFVLDTGASLVQIGRQGDAGGLEDAADLAGDGGAG